MHLYCILSVTIVSTQSSQLSQARYLSMVKQRGSSCYGTVHPIYTTYCAIHIHMHHALYAPHTHSNHRMTAQLHVGISFQPHRGPQASLMGMWTNALCWFAWDHFQRRTNEVLQTHDKNHNGEDKLPSKPLSSVPEEEEEAGMTHQHVTVR